MSEPGTPWWYSGADNEEGDDAESQKKADGPSLPNLDWTALASGAQRLVDWATEKVMAPHADHSEPREHPQCPVCRTMLLIGERPSAATDEAVTTASPAQRIEWIPIMGESPEA